MSMLPTTPYPLPNYLFGTPAGIGQPQLTQSPSAASQGALAPRFGHDAAEGEGQFRFDDYGLDYRPLQPFAWLPYFSGGLSTSPQNQSKPHSLVILA